MDKAGEKERNWLTVIRSMCSTSCFSLRVERLQSRWWGRFFRRRCGAITEARWPISRTLHARLQKLVHALRLLHWRLQMAGWKARQRVGAGRRWILQQTARQSWPGGEAVLIIGRFVFRVDRGRALANSRGRCPQIGRIFFVDVADIGATNAATAAHPIQLLAAQALRIEQQIACRSSLSGQSGRRRWIITVQHGELRSGITISQ